MTGLPPLAAEVIADAVEALPVRLAKKLDEVLGTARSWPVSRVDGGWTVTAGEAAVVRIAESGGDPHVLTCSCLLAPRCLHRAAVASLAPPLVADAGPAPAPDRTGDTDRATDPDPTAGPDPTGDMDPTADPDPTGDMEEITEAEPTPGADGTGEPADRPVTAAEVAAAGDLARVAATILGTGIPGAGAVAQAALLRAAHQARVLRLPRAASAAVRVVEHLRAARADDPGFRLDDLVTDMRELLAVTAALRAGKPWHGSARREYRLVTDARLAGIACEPIVTASGYAGAVTHLADASGRLWQIGTVLPGGDRAAAVRADTPIAVGDARVTPRELGRSGLLGVDLRASADGRIGTGRQARAVRTGASDWDAPALAGRWAAAWPEQIGRYRDALALPVEERPAGHDLVFLDGMITGYAPGGPGYPSGGVGFAVPGAAVTLVAPADTGALGYVDNLRLLGRSAGAPARIVGRPAGRGRVAAIALGAPWLRADLGGHADLGLDVLVTADLPRLGENPEPPAPEAPMPEPPLHLIGRALERAVEAGRFTVAARASGTGTGGDAARLRAASMPTAATLLEALEATARPERDVFGRVSPGSADAFADAWLAAAVYVHTVRLAVDYS